MGQASRLIIRADANEEIGCGHVMRSLALVQEWVARGGKALFVSDCIKPLKKRICCEGAEIVEVDKKAKDLGLTVLLDTASEKDWVVLDGYGFDIGYQKKVRERCRTVVIDDYAHRKSYDADILLNPNIHGESVEYGETVSGSVALGSMYALMRKEFFPAQKTVDSSAKESCSDSKVVLVSMGGSDSCDATSLVVEALSSLGDQEFRFVVVLGAANGNSERVKRMLAASGHSYEVIAASSDMGTIMRQVDVAVASASVTASELACCGVPAVLLTTADNQQGIGEAFQKAGAAIHAGDISNVSGGIVAKAVHGLLDDAGTRERMGRCAKSLIDGLGSRRLVDIMTTISNSRIDWGKLIRPLSKKDARQLWFLANDSVVRSNAFGKEFIPYETHVQWLNGQLESNDSVSYVADVGGVVAGQLRTERESRDVCNISYAVGPAFRGKGLGTYLLRIARQGARELGCSKAVGRVLIGNEFSVRCFEKSGFTLLGKETVKGQLCYCYEGGVS